MVEQLAGCTERADLAHGCVLVLDLDLAQRARGLDLAILGAGHQAVAQAGKRHALAVDANGEAAHFALHTGDHVTQVLGSDFAANDALGVAIDLGLRFGELVLEGDLGGQRLTDVAADGSHRGLDHVGTDKRCQSDGHEGDECHLLHLEFSRWRVGGTCRT